MFFQHRCRSFKCFSALLFSVVIFCVYYAFVEPKLRHVAYAIARHRLEALLKNSTGSKVCTSAKETAISSRFALCREWNHGKLPQKDIRVISVETHNFEFENELAAELGPKISFFVFGFRSPGPGLSNGSRSHVTSRPWLRYALRVPYFGRQALLAAFQEFLLETASAAPHKPYTIFKLGGLSDALNPWLLGRVLEEEVAETFQQLHVEIQTGSDDPAVAQQWTEAIAELQRRGFRLFKTKAYQGEFESNYSTSWIRELENPPEKAMLNPLDNNVNLERKLHELLTEPTISCNRRIAIPVSDFPAGAGPGSATGLQWPVCVENLQQPCVVYSAKFKGPETFENAMANLGCTVFLFDPTLNATDEVRGPGNRIRALSWAMGTVNAKIVSGLEDSEAEGMLTYVKASEIAAKLNHQDKMIDVLRLDLRGGEWDVLHSLVSSQLIENYHQIVVAMHVWHGEEVFSLIDRFVRLQKLLSAGFEVYYSQPLDDSPARVDLKEQSCCFVVGWLKTT